MLIRKFTEEDKNRILATYNFQKRAREIWDVVLESVGQSWDEKSSISPWDYTLRYEDGIWCGKVIMDTVAGDLEKSEALMSWMNIGPSTESKPMLSKKEKSTYEVRFEGWIHIESESEESAKKAVEAILDDTVTEYDIYEVL